MELYIYFEVTGRARRQCAIITVFQTQISATGSNGGKQRKATHQPESVEPK
jgi:hypothetical protein